MKVEELSKPFIEYLYDFWMENYANMCEYCVYDVPCSDNCSCYKNFGDNIVSVNTDNERQISWNQELTCMDLDFGECDKLKDTPCYRCMEDNRFHFKWNKRIPTDMESF